MFIGIYRDFLHHKLVINGTLSCTELELVTVGQIFTWP